MTTNTRTPPVCAATGRMLIIDDEPVIGRMMAEYLIQLGHEAVSEVDPVRALELAKEGSFDIVFTDIYMPQMSGTDVLREIIALNRNILVILMTGQPTLENTISAIRLGAYDYLTKPFNLELIELLTARALKQRRLILENQEYQLYLEDKVKVQTEELREFLFHSVESLAYALEARDPYTKGHGYRVSQFVLTLAERLGVPHSDYEALRLAGILHDIGKIGVPDEILLKAGPLTPEEYGTMKDHAEQGYRILAPIDRLSEVARYVYEHHECWDGSGYPRGLKGDEIHPNSRLLVVAEVCDALATERCYKPAWPPSQIIEYFEENSGTRYDAEVVNVLNNLLVERGDEVCAQLRDDAHMPA